MGAERRMVWRLEKPDNRYLVDVVSQKRLASVLLDHQKSGVNFYKIILGSETDPLWTGVVRGMRNAQAQVEIRIQDLGKAKLVELTT